MVHAPRAARRRAPRLVLALASVFLLVGCRDDTEPAGPRTLRPPSVPHANSATGGAAALQMTISQAAPKDGSSGNVVVGHFDTDVLATLDISGTLVGTPTAFGQQLYKFQTITYEAGGWSDGYSCWGNVWVQGVTPNGVRNFWYHPPCFATNSSATGLIRGDVVYTRFPAYHACANGYDPGACWTYQSSVTVTVTPVQATMTLSASPSVITPGDTVTFTLSLSPTEQGGFSVPFTVTANRWVPDSGADSTAKCHFAGPGTCRVPIATSGHVEVDATVNGKSLTVSQPVVFSAVKPKLTLTASPSSIVVGDTVTFVASVSPAAIGNYAVPFQPKQWWWVPDDTASPPPILADVQSRQSRTRRAPWERNRRVPRLSHVRATLAAGDSGTLSPACPDGAATCRVPIGASGTMHVAALVDGVLDTAVAHVTAVDSTQIKLVLTCSSGPVTRGGSVTCTASGYPASVIPTIKGWQFDASDPAVGTIVRAGETASSLEWSGEMAVSGTVSVSGVVRGKPASVTADITVQPRSDWATRHPTYSAPEVPQYKLDTLPHADSSLGKTTYLGAVPAGGRATGPLDESLYRVIPPGGPNEYVAYMVSMHTEVLEIQINTYAMSVGSTFWMAQPAVRTGNICSRDEMVAQVSGVRKHEGTAFDYHSHTWFYKSKLDAEDVGSKVEQVVGLGGITAEQLNSTIAVEQQAAFVEAKKADDPLYNPWTPPCAFNYNY